MTDPGATERFTVLYDEHYRRVYAYAVSRAGRQLVGATPITPQHTGALSSMVEAPVVDKTGLTGVYNYTLQFGRDWSAHDSESWPSIFTAVQEQIGLKIDSTKALVDVLVIDHAEQPSPN